MLMHAQPSTNGRQHEDAPLRGLANFLQRNRLLIGGLALAVLLATFAFLQFARPVYESAVSLRVDQERSNVAVLDASRQLISGDSRPASIDPARGYRYWLKPGSYTLRVLTRDYEPKTAPLVVPGTPTVRIELEPVKRH